MIEEFRCMFCNEYGDSNIIERAHIIPRCFFKYLYHNFNDIKKKYKQISNIKNKSKFKKDLLLMCNNESPKFLKYTHNNNYLRLCRNCHGRFDTIIHKRNLDKNNYFYRLDKNKNNNYKFLELHIPNNKTITKYNNIILDYNKIFYIDLYIKLNKNYISSVKSNNKYKNKNKKRKFNLNCCKKNKKINKKQKNNIINVNYDIILNNILTPLVNEFNNNYK